jgi:hypothetical protein
LFQEHLGWISEGDQALPVRANWKIAAAVMAKKEGRTPPAMVRARVPTGRGGKKMAAPTLRSEGG